MPRWVRLLVVFFAFFNKTNGSPDQQKARGFTNWKTVPRSAECADQSVECPLWAASNECTLNRAFMGKRCRLACGLCNATSSSSAAASASFARSFAPWPGSASEEGTRHFAMAHWRNPDRHFRRDPGMGLFFYPGQHVRSNPWLTVSSLAIGAYGARSADPQSAQSAAQSAQSAHSGPSAHADAAAAAAAAGAEGPAAEAAAAEADKAIEDAVVESVAAGCNVLATGPAFRGGRSEAAAGAALRRLRVADSPNAAAQAAFSALITRGDPHYAAGIHNTYNLAAGAGRSLAQSVPRPSPAGRALTASSRKVIRQRVPYERTHLFVSTRAGLLSRSLVEAIAAAPDLEAPASELLLLSDAGASAPSASSVSSVSAGSAGYEEHAAAYCIHPACLNVSLTASLRGLGLRTVDALLLDVPFLREPPAGRDGSRSIAGGGAGGGRVEGEPRRQRERLKEAFRHLEAERSAGRLRAYGLAFSPSAAAAGASASSEAGAPFAAFTLFSAPGEPRHLSLQEAVDAAAEAGGPHHGLRYVQLPLGVSEPRAWSLRSQLVRAPAAAAAGQTGAGWSKWGRGVGAGEGSRGGKRGGAGGKEGRAGGEMLLLTPLEAAARLGVSVWGAPQGGGDAAAAVAALLEAEPELGALGGIAGAGARITQACQGPAIVGSLIARSAPLALGTIVGHSEPSLVAQGAALAFHEPLTEEQFGAISARLERIAQTRARTPTQAQEQVYEQAAYPAPVAEQERVVGIPPPPVPAAPPPAPQAQGGAADGGQGKVFWRKEMLRGGSGRRPQRGASVTVHCTGFGKHRDPNVKFWSTHDEGQSPFTFKVGLGMVIRGWDESVMTMQVGELARITVSPEYAYGPGGFEAWGIDPDSELIFEIEVLSIEGGEG